MCDPDTDDSGIPDWWEQFRKVTPLRFGDGSDGPLVVHAGQTNFTDAVRASVTGSNPGSSSTLSVSATNGFRPNDLALIIAMQDPNTDLNQNIVGLYEFVRVAGFTNNGLVLDQPLSDDFSVTGN